MPKVVWRGVSCRASKALYRSTVRALPAQAEAAHIHSTSEPSTSADCCVGLAAGAATSLAPSTLPPCSIRSCHPAIRRVAPFCLTSLSTFTTSCRSFATAPTSSYGSAVDCDAYGYDTSALKQPTIDGHSLPIANPAALPDLANVVVVRAFSPEKNKLTPRMKMVLKMLIDAHVSQWKAHQPHGTSGSGGLGTRVPRGGESVLPLVIVSVSNGASRQAQRDQRKLDVFLATLDGVPDGAVFVCAMTTPQGKALGGPFAKPSKRVATAARQAHTAQTAAEEKANAAASGEKVVATADDAGEKSTDGQGAVRGSVQPFDPASEPLMDIQDVDDTATTDLQELEAEEMASAPLSDPSDVQQEINDVLHHVDDDALVSDLRDDERTLPFPQAETDGTVGPLPDGRANVAGAAVDVAPIGKARHVRRVKLVKRRKKVRADHTRNATATTSSSWPRFQPTTRIDAVLTPVEDSLPPPTGSTPTLAGAVPHLEGPCATATRYVAAKTMYLSDVLHEVLPPAANVMVVDRRSAWRTDPMANSVDGTSEQATRAAAVRAHVEREVEENVDGVFGPLLVHPEAYVLTSDIDCDPGRAKSAWLPTLIVFQTNWSPVEAVSAQEVLEGALRRVRHMQGRLGGVYVATDKEADAVIEALEKTVREGSHRAISAEQRPSTRKPQATSLSGGVSDDAAPTAIDAMTADGEVSSSLPSAAMSAETRETDASAQDTSSEVARAPATATTATPATSLSAFGRFSIKLPEMSLFGWSSPPKAPSPKAAKRVPPKKAPQAVPAAGQPALVSAVSEARRTAHPAPRTDPSHRARMTKSRVKPAATAAGGILAPGFAVQVPGLVDRIVPEASASPVDTGMRYASEAPAAATRTDAVSGGHKTPARRLVLQPHMSEEEAIDAAVQAVLNGTVVEALLPHTRTVAPRSTTPPLLVPVTVPASAWLRHKKAKTAPSKVKATTTTSTSTATAESPSAAPKSAKPIDFDALVESIIEEATRTADDGTAAHAPGGSSATRANYSWDTVGPSGAKKAKVVVDRSRQRGAAGTSRQAAKGTARKSPRGKKTLSKAELARVAKLGQARAAASRRRFKAAVAAVTAIRDENHAVPAIPVADTDKDKGKGKGKNKSKGQKKSSSLRRAKLPSPAFALPSPENYQSRASKAELMALHRVLEGREMPGEKTLEALPAAQAARFARAVSVYPGVRCHGNTKEKIQMLSWFPAERFKDTYRHLSVSKRAAPCTVVLMAQRVLSPKVFVTSAQQNELVVRTVGAIVYACGKNEAMHPLRRQRIAGGKILCFVFRNDLTLLACERHQATLEKVLRTVKGFERVKVFVTTPLPSTKKRVVT